MDYLPEDIPEGPLLDPVDTLSFLFLDGAGKSKLGFHMDTMQATPCTCSSDSLYPPGCYDVTGAEIILANGLWGDSYAREDCVLLAGPCVHAYRGSSHSQQPFPLESSRITKLH